MLQPKFQLHTTIVTAVMKPSLKVIAASMQVNGQKKGTCSTNFKVKYLFCLFYSRKELKFWSKLFTLLESTFIKFHATRLTFDRYRPFFSDSIFLFQVADGWNTNVRAIILAVAIAV